MRSLLIYKFADGFEIKCFGGLDVNTSEKLHGKLKTVKRWNETKKEWEFIKDA